jgi:hypothetical protein
LFGVLFLWAFSKILFLFDQNIATNLGPKRLDVLRKMSLQQFEITTCIKSGYDGAPSPSAP